MKLKLPELYDPNDLIALAVKSYSELKTEQFIQVWLNGQKEAPYIASYFKRSYEQMPSLEKKAMELAFGKTLDIGAGAGPHTAHLLENDLEVHSLELNSMHCQELRRMAKTRVFQEDFFSWNSTETYDTLLLLMNGFGICQQPEYLLKMGQKLKKLLAKNGQILAEITDYDYSDFYDHDIKDNPTVTFRLRYDEKFSREFKWFYPKLNMVKTMCEKLSLNLEKLHQEEEMLLLRITHL